MQSAINKEKALKAALLEAKALKITTQYRDKRGMVYELAAGANTIDVHVWEERVDGHGAGWHVEARDRHDGGTAVVTRFAATRVEALREIADWWTASAATRELAPFDWDAVAALLVSVRAL